MKKEIPRGYAQHLESRGHAVLTERETLSLRAVWVGAFLSFFLATAVPYGNMVQRGSSMALDFSTPGAIFLFFVLIGVLNVLFKMAARDARTAAVLVVGGLLFYVYHYWPLTGLDIYAPGLHFASFMVASALANAVAVRQGTSLALNRAELILVYAMLLIVSALCTMGLSEKILPMMTGLFYYASPTNNWEEKLFPYVPSRAILVDDGEGNKAFYEGTGSAGQVPYGAWVEPLLWWGIFLLALYVTMICVAVILRRQWMERERLAFPIVQVPLAMVRGEEEGLVNGFLKRKTMWVGCAIPMVMGSLKALNSYDPTWPVISTTWVVPLFGLQTMQLTISYAMLGFSYLINTNIAMGIWFFYLLSKVEKEALLLMRLTSDQKLAFGASDYPLLAYQGGGALIAMVLVGLWIGRHHFKDVVMKALGRAPYVDDRDEILPYRFAVWGGVAGIGVMTGWMWLMGTPLWVSVVFVVLALLIFVGIARIVAEAGLASVREPINAPNLVLHGLGSELVGAQSAFNLSLAYIWAADLRIFVLASCIHALKLVEEMDRRSRRYVLWAIVLALALGALGSIWMIFHVAYKHGGINLEPWFFRGLAATAYSNALQTVEPAAIYWPGWSFFAGGGIFMALMMWARQRHLWWPVHPLGFTIAGNYMMNYVWFNVFIAWAIKKLVLRFGGAAIYQRSQAFFLGLIVGQVMCNGVWLIIDYFTGKVGNSIYWV